MYRPVSRATASTTFMRGPPSTMIRRCQRGLAWKPRGGGWGGGAGLLVRAFPAGPSPRHFHEAAQEEHGRDAVVGLAPAETEEPRPEAEAESFNADIEKARCPEVSQLVDEDHHADQDQEPESALKKCHTI